MLSLAVHGEDSVCGRRGRWKLSPSKKHPSSGQIEFHAVPMRHFSRAIQLRPQSSHIHTCIFAPLLLLSARSNGGSNTGRCGPRDALPTQRCSRRRHHGYRHHGNGGAVRLYHPKLAGEAECRHHGDILADWRDDHYIRCVSLQSGGGFCVLNGRTNGGTGWDGGHAQHIPTGANISYCTTAAMGGAYEFCKSASANLRQKDDAMNQAFGGFVAGSMLGLSCKRTTYDPSRSPPTNTTSMQSAQPQQS